MSTLKPVKSTNIAALGYDADTNTLDVQFRDKEGEPRPETYRFRSVPRDVGEPLMAMDEGIGSAFARTVRGKFPHEVIKA